MPLSEYDKLHIDDILAGEGSWFYAYLLRYIGSLPLDDRRYIATGFPEEVRRVAGQITAPHKAPCWHHVHAKADVHNRAKMQRCYAVEPR